MRSIYKIDRQLMKFENQCSCFGATNLENDQFLAKHKTSDIISPSNSNQLNHQNSQSHLAKNGFKKSLKKTFNPTFHASNAKCKETCEHSYREKVLPHSNSQREIQEYSSPRGNIGNQYNPMQTMNHQINNHATQYFDKEINKNNHHPLQIRPFYMAQPPLINPHPSLQHTSSIKICYNNSNTSHSVTNSKCPSQTSKQVGFFSCKQLPKQSDTHSFPLKPQPNTTITSGKHSKNEHGLQSLTLSKDDINDFDSLDLQNSVDQDEVELKIKEQEEMLKEIPKKLAAKFNLQLIKKSQMGTLKKMDDVMEICSQADSEQDEDSDNESIVVGRLNEYCSMLEPKYESSSTIEKSFQNKLAGITSISSTISHCHFNRKKENF